MEAPMRRINLTAVLVAFLAMASAHAATPPYPPSTVIQGITWDTSTYKFTGVGGDLWPTTWSADDTLRSAFGDGQIGCSTTVSYGPVTLGGTPPVDTMQRISCGPAGLNKGKIMALGAAGTTLYGRFAAQPSGSIASLEIKRSTDEGMTWQPGWSPVFATSAFVQFGKGNEGAPDGYVYLISVTNGNSVQLTRFLPAKWNVGTAYEYFSGTPSAPAWSTRLSARKPVFYDPNGVQAPTLQYVPGLKRYLLTGAHTRPGQAGVFDSPNVYGPWTTVSYVESRLGLGMSGEYWSTYFPIKWQSEGGTKLWATFSCHNAKAPAILPASSTTTTSTSCRPSFLWSTTGR